MILLVVAVLFLAVMLGAVAHAPLPLSLVAATLIGAWLLGFAVRERLRHHGGNR
ncbi:hypothetical protein [Streptomyces sp. NPDC005438]|uniref:hypothetical protein n=1 Tax=Streptomyces sp. NPDC005438 TaxID=3156880 RepID=UPI0033A8C926